MSDIFISCAREDQDRAGPLARALEKLGYTVSWQLSVPPGTSYGQVVQEELQAASAIIVLWSSRSVASDWVSAVAAEAEAERKLFPAFLEEVRPPLQFRLAPAFDLVDWDGSTSTGDFPKLAVALGQYFTEEKAKKEVRVGEKHLPDVFIGYARSDRDAAQQLSENLEEHGLSVWWDREIPLGEEWDRIIEDAISDARVVLILWSRDGAESEWLREEAYYGHKQQKLVQAVVDDATVPLEFRLERAIDLSRWEGSPQHPALLELTDSLARFTSVHAGPASLEDERQTRPRPTRSADAQFDVFLSYARVDQAEATNVAEALERQGRIVWWDRKIPPGRRFYEVIGNAINASKTVAVLWSQNSASSEEVKDEAYEGKERDVLVPARLDHSTLPFGFKRIQAADLTNWTPGDTSHPGFREFLRAIAELLRR